VNVAPFARLITSGFVLQALRNKYAELKRQLEVERKRKLEGKPKNCTLEVCL
jgi:hypothetical protein